MTSLLNPLDVAAWVDDDLDEDLDQTLRYQSTRLFAVVADTDGLHRELIDCDPDPYRLLTRFPTPRRIDAACLVMTGWMSRVDDDDDDELDDDDDDGDGEVDVVVEPVERFRVRVTAAVTDDGVSVVVRRFGPEGVVDRFSDGGEGLFPEALVAWWTAYSLIRTPPADRR